jgi:Sulfotransferase family
MQRSPLVIVGTGGSGTRAFARLAEASGRSMGAHQNEANDALALLRFAHKWCPRIYRAWQAGEAVDQAEFEAELRPCLDAHLSETEAGVPWGWKQPRSIYMLPPLAALYPDLLVLHVLRDGRDIAFGKQFRLDVAGSYAVPPSAEAEAPEVRLAILWADPNRLAADFGEGRLGERYLRLRLEDLCTEPLETAKRLTAFAGGDPVEPDRVRAIVETPPTLGRWRAANPELLTRVTQVARGSLKRFGYA